MSEYPPSVCARCLVPRPPTLPSQCKGCGALLLLVMDSNVTLGDIGKAATVALAAGFSRDQVRKTLDDFGFGLVKATDGEATPVFFVSQSLDAGALNLLHPPENGASHWEYISEENKAKIRGALPPTEPGQ